MSKILSSDSTRRDNVVVIITASIAAYKAVECVRELVKAGKNVKCILTQNATHFVTPFTLQALTGHPVYTELFSLTDEQQMGHIELSRWADIIIVCPATAHIIAQCAHGLADDLASTLLLATLKDTPIFMAPAMNVGMWNNAATQQNLSILKERGINIIPPEEGKMACHEYGMGRLAALSQILSAIERNLTPSIQVDHPLHVLVTAGPTYEPIDPIRFIGNYSSGQQGYAIAHAFLAAGAKVTLISGPVDLPPPSGVILHKVKTAEEMLSACMQTLPVDIAVMCAAVGDWRVEKPSSVKIKKSKQEEAPTLKLIPNPDILARISQHKSQRPALVIGFAAETHDLAHYAQEKLATKGCDWIVANDVSAQHGVMGKPYNKIRIFTATSDEVLPQLSKTETAQYLVAKAIEAFKDLNNKHPLNKKG